MDGEMPLESEESELYTCSACNNQKPLIWFLHLTRWRSTDPCAHCLPCRLLRSIKRLHRPLARELKLAEERVDDAWSRLRAEEWLEGKQGHDALDDRDREDGMTIAFYQVTPVTPQY